MGNWSKWIQDEDYGLEFKISNSGKKIIMRDLGQRTNYPRWTGVFNNGILESGHGSISKRGERWGTEELMYKATLLMAIWGDRY